MGETDLLVSFFTADKGRLKGVAKGARKSRKRFANCLDAFCLTKMEYEEKANRDLLFLRSGKLIDGFSGIRTDFYALALASYMAELAETLFPMGVQAKRMFSLLKNMLPAVSKEADIKALRIFFEARALALGGYGINLERCCRCGRRYAGEGRAVFKPKKGGIACLKCEKESIYTPGMNPETAKALYRLQEALKDGPEDYSLPREVLEEMRKILDAHLRYTLGRELKTARYL